MTLGTIPWDRTAARSGPGPQRRLPLSVHAAPAIRPRGQSGTGGRVATVRKGVEGVVSRVAGRPSAEGTPAEGTSAARVRLVDSADAEGAGAGVRSGLGVPTAAGTGPTVPCLPASEAATAAPPTVARAAVTARTLTARPAFRPARRPLRAGGGGRWLTAHQSALGWVKTSSRQPSGSLICAERRHGEGQNAASSSSISEVSTASAIARSAESLGSTCRVKNRAAATLPS
jgi:hypothetical protein